MFSTNLDSIKNIKLAKYGPVEIKHIPMTYSVKVCSKITGQQAGVVLSEPITVSGNTTYKITINCKIARARSATLNVTNINGQQLLSQELKNGQTTSMLLLQGLGDQQIILSLVTDCWFILDLFTFDINKLTPLIKNSLTGAIYHKRKYIDFNKNSADLSDVLDKYSTVSMINCYFPMPPKLHRCKIDYFVSDQDLIKKLNSLKMA